MKVLVRKTLVTLVAILFVIIGASALFSNTDNSNGLSKNLTAFDAGSSPVKAYYDWSGYNGNSTIYMSTVITSSNPFILQSAYSYGFAPAGSSDFGLANGIGISTGGMISDGPNVSWEYEEGYWSNGNLNGNLVVYIPFQVAGIDAQQYYYSASYAESEFVPLYYNESYINLTTQNNVSVKVSGLPDSTIQFDDQYNGGLNVSSDTFDFGSQFQDQSAAANQSVINILMDLLGLAPDIGTVLGIKQALDDSENSAGLYGQNVSLSLNGPPIGQGHTLTGNGCLEETYGVDEGNYTSEIGSGWSQGEDWQYWLVDYGNNSFALRQLLELTISESNFDSSGMITLHAANNVSSIYQNNDPKGWQSIHPSAYISLSIHAMPAYTVHGTAENNGQLLKNQYIEFYDSNGTAYYVMTDSNGYYRFFADPGHDYLTEFPGNGFPNPSGRWVNVTTGDTGGETVSLSFGAANGFFSTIQGYVKQQNGFPGSATVTVSYGGDSESTGTNTNGFYSLGVNEPYDYELEVKSIYNNDYYSIDVVSDNSAYWKNVTIASYSGGGCVLYGTNISLANGSTIPVQDLSAGMHVLAFNTNTDELYQTKVSQIQASKVSTIVNIDGLISLSGLNDQPVYVKLSNGTQEWLVLGAINTTMSIYDPLNNTWVPVFNYTLVSGNFTVYEIITKKGFYIDNHSLQVFDYIANGFLVDRKIG